MTAQTLAAVIGIILGVAAILKSLYSAVRAAQDLLSGVKQLLTELSELVIYAHRRLDDVEGELWASHQASGPSRSAAPRAASRS
jgi:hypothetical protein